MQSEGGGTGHGQAYSAAARSTRFTLSHRLLRTMAHGNASTKLQRCVGIARRCRLRYEKRQAESICDLRRLSWERQGGPTLPTVPNM